MVSPHLLLGLLEAPVIPPGETGGRTSCPHVLEAAMPEAPPEEVFISLQQAAEQTGLSVKAIRREVSKGTIDGFRYGRSIRVRRDDLSKLFRRMPSAVTE